MAAVQVGSPDTTTLDPVSVVEKVVVNLKATGNAPQLKTRKFNVDSSKTVAWLVQWLRKTLKCADDESVFVYVQQSFSPALDVDMETLSKMYGSGGKLIVNYSKTQAWG